MPACVYAETLMLGLICYTGAYFEYPCKKTKKQQHRGNAPVINCGEHTLHMTNTAIVSNVS